MSAYVTGTLRHVEAMTDEEWLQRIGPQTTNPFVLSVLDFYLRTGKMTPRQRTAVQQVRAEWTRQLEVALRRTVESAR